MSLNDDQLRDLLKHWKDVEPKASFESNVWRRIRLAEAEETERTTIAERLWRSVTQPAWAMATAVIVSVIIGSSTGVVTSRPRASVTRGELQFLGAGTLAGGYSKLATGGTR